MWWKDEKKKAPEGAFFFSLYCFAAARDVHSFPTRRSSDLGVATAPAVERRRAARVRRLGGGRRHGGQRHEAAVDRGADRSEERRVGKECRSRWWAYVYRKRTGADLAAPVVGTRRRGTRLVDIGDRG